MNINSKHRTNAIEIMDDFTLEGEILREALDKIAKINQLLGGNKLTLQGVLHLLSKESTKKEVIIVDIGCGNGDMLRTLAVYANKNDLNFKLIGIDANQFTIEHAESLSKNYRNISYRCEDIFDYNFKSLKYDILLCTLTMHHFNDYEIVQLLSIFKSNATIGIVINDLQRSAMAYRLFQVLCVVFRLNKMSKKDGLVSILRGFKKEELEVFSNKLSFQKYTIKWKWAYRYQWIIETRL